MACIHAPSASLYPGWIAFLSFDTRCGSSTLFKARLHSPVDTITVLAKKLKAKEVHSVDGMIRLASDSGPIKAIEFNEGSIYMIPSKKKKKGDLVELATKLRVCNAGTMAKIKPRLRRYSETVNDQYLAHDVRNDEVHFWDLETKPNFEAMACADGDFIYAAEVIEKSIGSFSDPKGWCWSQRY